ncbi:MAG: phospholipase D-like domain-containing protein [Candidatus Bipolaricaulota bacterium]|nr:hypothetical protein [Candidatus Bipolaricaulota bacterium]
MSSEYRSFLKKLSVLIALGLAVFSLVAKPAEVTVTPLLDTPNNRTYYDELLSTVRDAESSIRVMMATANYYPEYPDGLQNRLYDALVDAKGRGVNVKIILDKSDWSGEITKTNRETAQYLRDRGLRVKFDDPEVTTHSKTVIVDEEVVLLGSSNWNFPTYTETYQANLKLVSGEVGRFYGRFFDAAWRGKPPERLKLPEISGGKSIVPLISTKKSRAYFETARQLIRDAGKSIDLVLFKITRYSSFGESKSNLLTEELVKARNRGVEVRIVLDVNTWSEEINQTNRETALWLLGKGVKDVKFDNPEVTTHSKILIVDGESVLVGSSNWSYYSLAENLEMDVAIKKLPSVAKPFETYFEEIWKRAEIPSRKELSGAS